MARVLFAHAAVGFQQRESGFQILPLDTPRFSNVPGKCPEQTFAAQFILGGASIVLGIGGGGGGGGGGGSCWRDAVLARFLMNFSTR